MSRSENLAEQSRRLRILAVSEDNPYVAGGRVAFWTVIHRLAMRHDVKLVALEGATEDLFPMLPGEHRVRLPIRRFRTLLFPIVLLRIVKSFEKFDLILTSQGFTATFILVIARMKRLPVVTYIHDTFTLEELLQLSPKNLELLGATWRYISSYAFLRFYTAVLCISETAATRLIRSGVKDNKLWLTYSPVKLSSVSSVPRNDHLLLVVARVEANKRPELALELMKYLTDFSLSWIGGGTLLEEYSKKTSKMGSSISFLGKVTEDEKWHFMASAHCLLSFSEFEGFWIPGFEALSIGTPVVALKLPVLEEVYGHKIGYAESLKEMARKVRELEPLRPAPVPVLYSPQNVADRAEACLQQVFASSISVTPCDGIQPWKIFLIPKECTPARVIDVSYGTRAVYKPFLAHLGESVWLESKCDAKGHLIVNPHALSIFLDGEFGYLWSSEVLDHMPIDLQDPALREWMRIARHGCATYATERHSIFKLNHDHDPVKIKVPPNATYRETADGEALIQW